MVTGHGTQLEQLDKGLSMGVHSTLTSTEVGIFIIEITPQIHPTHPLKKKNWAPVDYRVYASSNEQSKKHEFQKKSMKLAL